MAAKKKKNSKTKSTAKKQTKQKTAKKPAKKVLKKAKPVKKKTVSAKKSTQKRVPAKVQKAKAGTAKKGKAVKKAAVRKNMDSKPKAQKTFLTPAPKAAIDYSKAVTPLGDRLVVRVVNGERVTAGGLIIPATASMATGYLKAVVLAAGAGSKNKKGSLRPLDVQIGDEVLFSEHAGIKIRFNAEDLQIIHETDVMGIVQN